jgi:hypothetical protein
MPSTKPEPDKYKTSQSSAVIWIQLSILGPNLRSDMDAKVWIPQAHKRCAKSIRRDLGVLSHHTHSFRHRLMRRIRLSLEILRAQSVWQDEPLLHGRVFRSPLSLT